MPSNAICVGFSGGVDSVVLLDSLVEGRSAAITAVHVHHGLSANADAWADFCRDFCRARGIPLDIERVTVDRAAPEGLEAAARRQRYAIYAARPEPCVALAHHLDDQAETVLLQLLRGTGLKGVAAMPELRALPGSHVQVYRPMLEMSRAQIVARAKERGLAWIDDESNASTRHDRNYLRHEIAPLLDARFPGWREAVARFSKHAASADALLDEMAHDDGPDAGALDWAADASMYLHVHLNEERRANALRSFLARNALPMPTTAQLAQMSRQLYDARDDAEVRFEYGGVAIRRHRRRAYMEKPRAQQGAWRVDWHGEREVALGAARGSVRFVDRVGEGIDPARVASGDWYFAARSGGEKIRLGPRAHLRTLKNLFQERGIPGEARRDFPCLFNDGRLVWVAGLGLDAQYQVGEGLAGLFPSWNMA